MITKELTCIECPMGCHIEVDLEYDNKVVAVRGNSCPRGKAYAETEVVCPMRVVTSSSGDRMALRVAMVLETSEVVSSWVLSDIGSSPNPSG